jgi:hypothetical protein
MASARTREGIGTVSVTEPLGTRPSSTMHLLIFFGHSCAGVAGLTLALWIFCLVASGSVNAEVLKFTAALSPISGGSGSGQAEFKYDTETAQLQYLVVFENLSGPASAGDIHAPAAGGVGGKTVMQFPVPQSPIGGTVTLTLAEAEALRAGRLAVVIRTSAYPDGEIRGQIVP